MLPGASYRADIDGLRAVAVLAVLVFHAFPNVLPGGFVGVDMFFVISGFLISGIIFEDLKRGRFSFANFYWRRIRRIFPALILVLGVCLALGWLMLLPDEYAQLGRHIAAGAGFVANLALWRDTGYFDTAIEFKPLLHLWSLGVEEQYYLAWPLILYAFRRHALWMIAALGGVSFAGNIYLTATSPGAAFYLPGTRFWELLVGSALAWGAAYGKPSDSNVRALLGALLAVAGFALINADSLFPGWWALLPVAGTALLVSAGPAAWINRAILSHPIAVFVGLISYPLYLWHWPLLSFARIVEGGEITTALRIAILIASFALAWLTYELIEKPIRFGASPVRRIAVPALAAMMIGVGLGGVMAYGSALIPQSAAIPQLREITGAAADWEFRGDKVIAGDSPKTVLFFGDSHMQQYWPRIERVMVERAQPVRTAAIKSEGGCAPVPGIERQSVACARVVDEGIAFALVPEVDTVVLAASWVGFVERPDYYKVGDDNRTPLKLLAPGTEWVLEGFESALRKIVASGKRVIIVLSSPRGESFDPKSLIDRGIHIRVRAKPAVSRAEIDAQSAVIDGHLKRIAATVGAEWIDPKDWLCRATHCPTTDEAGRPLYKDTSHLRSSFVRENLGALDSYIYAH